MERPCFRSGRVGESGGWIGNNQKDGREAQVWFRREELSGSGSAFGCCSSKGLPVRSRNASQSGRVRTRRGEKLKGTRRCCLLLHLDGAPSASGGAVEGDAEAVVQAPVGVVVE